TPTPWSPARDQPEMNLKNLEAEWDVQQCSTAEDWLDWMKRLNVELLRESPSHALRGCSTLAQVGFQPLAKNLFHAAFTSCWTQM
ncbi:unnamed protein product, partial [Discosporangium mesarthrocarpum]